MPELNLWAVWIGILLGMITGAGMGLLCHTTDVFDALYKFVEDAAPFDVQITYLTPFPNTPLYHQLKREGRLTHDGQWDRCTLFDINYQAHPDDRRRASSRLPRADKSALQRLVHQLAEGHLPTTVSAGRGRRARQQATLP